MVARSTGVVDANVELQVGRAADRRSRSNLAAAQRYGLKPGDVRRAAATLVAGEEVGDIFRGGKTYDVQVWSTPETRDSLTDIATAADRHAQRRARCGSATSPTCASSRPPTSSSARAARAGIDVARERRRAATSARSSRDVERAARRRRRSRSATTPSCSASTSERAGRAEPDLLLFALGAASAIFLLLQAVVRQLAAGRADLPHPADGAGRRRARRVRSAAASSRSARWSGSSPCSASPPATASC